MIPLETGVLPESPPGPLPSMSQLTAASSQRTSTWLPVSSWYVSSEIYAVKLAAAERYRQANLGQLQSTLFEKV